MSNLNRVVGKEGRKLIAERRKGIRKKRKEFGSINKLNGVCYYLYDKGFTNAANQHKIIKLYVLHMKWELPQERPIIEACVRIQDDFKNFIQWFGIVRPHLEREPNITTINSSGSVNLDHSVIRSGKWPHATAKVE